MRKFAIALFFLLVFATSVIASAELNELRTHMRSKVDEVEGIKWIHDKATPRNTHRNMCYVYLGQKNKIMWPRFFLGFEKEGWVFFQSIIFNVDGKREELNFNYFEIKRDNSGGIIWEYIDLDAEDHFELIGRIVKSSKTLVRFRGDQYRYDFTVSKKQKDAMKRVMRLYDLMKWPGGEG